MRNEAEGRRSPAMAALLAVWLLGFFPALPAAASGSMFEIDENELFSDTVSLLAESTFVTKRGSPSAATEASSLRLGGEVTAVGIGRAGREWFLGGRRREHAALGAQVISNLMLDVRLPRGVKAFGSVEAVAGGQDSLGNMNAELLLRELFVDANIARLAYFRAGKQVLQWGRCFFWNPTDMVNVERATFIEKIGLREGVMGLRAHVAFGVRANLYGFLDLHDLRAVDSVAGAARAELLLGGTEMSLSIWGKPHRKPVIGFDLSRGVPGGAILLFEASITDGSNYPTVGVDDDGYLYIKSRANTWYPRIALGLLGILDLFGVDDRLQIAVEGYFNGAAHSKQLLQDETRYPLRPQGPDDTAQTPYMSKAQFFMASNLHEDNSNARLYWAMFTSVDRFIVEGLTLQLNGIMNANDYSTLLTVGLTYTTLHDLALGISCTAFLGNNRSEYAMPGEGFMGRVSIGLRF